MSILVTLAQTAAQPQWAIGWPTAAILLIWTAASILIFSNSRLFRPLDPNGPVRWMPGEHAGLLIGMVFAAFAANILGAAVIYQLIRGLAPEQRLLTAGMLAGVFTFVAVVGMSASLRPRGIQQLGLAGTQVSSGFFDGLVGVIAFLPWVFWVMLIGAFILDKLHVKAPEQHEIFRVWKEPTTGPVFHILSIFSAVIIAPLAEESLFRGLVQTALSRLFIPRRPLPPAPPLPVQPVPEPATSAQVESPQSPASPPILSYATSHLPVPSTFARWLAIVATALLFAAIHQPAFIRPPIFVLALGLGYVYERTGNLWSSIFMHMLFNGFEFGLFLLGG